MSAEEVDKYLRGVEEPKRSVLQTLRGTILEIVREAEQVISYGIPAFRVRSGLCPRSAQDTVQYVKARSHRERRRR